MALDNEDLREALKRCSPATYYAACKFRQSGDLTQIPAIVLGVIERYVERDLRPKLQGDAATLLLREDLALDSLTMMEVVMLAEEVLQITISNEELTQLRTLGDVQRFLLAKIQEAPAPADKVIGPAATITVITPPAADRLAS
ncbi:MAG TPA: phosphopantetheine-binding protein [Opitutaceae bacterium]